MKPTELVCNFYMRKLKNRQEVASIEVHYRRKEPEPVVNLRDFYKQAVKASTTLKFKKQGVGIIFNSFSNDQFNNL